MGNDENIDTLYLRPPAAEDDADAQPGFGPAEFEYMCERLKTNTNVTHLNASFNAIGDDGARHLTQVLGAKGSDLMRLSLNNCGLGAAGASVFAQAIVGNRTLQTLELMGNNIDD